MTENERRPDGNCVISEEVIASIAASAATEVAGVAGLASRPNLRSLFTGTPASKAVAVDNADNALKLDVYLNFSYGGKIPEVAAAVQKAVKLAVQSMTGKPVTRVNVHVADVEIAADQTPVDVPEE